MSEDATTYGKPTEGTPPIIPLNGRVLIEELPFVPSKIIEVISGDRQDITEGIVRALSPKKLARRKVRGGWEHTGKELEHDVAVGDRVVFRPVFQDDDYLVVNRVKYRVMEPWDIEAIIEKPQPSGYEHPLTGQMMPDKHPLIGA